MKGGSHLMPLQHIQAEQHVHRLVLQDGERTGKEVPLYLYLSYKRTRQHNFNFFQSTKSQIIPDIILYAYVQLSKVWRMVHLGTLGCGYLQEIRRQLVCQWLF